MLNINTLSRSKISKDYLNLIRSEDFNPYIFEATRITEAAKTYLDHFHSNFASACTSVSIAVEIADHLPLFSIVYDPARSPFPDRIEYRNFKKFSNITFKADLKGKNWELVLNRNDCNESLSRFLHIFNRVSNKHAPLEFLSVRNKSSKPWITSGLKKSMETRDKLYKKWLLTHN